MSAVAYIEPRGNKGVLIHPQLQIIINLAFGIDRLIKYGIYGGET